MTASTPNLTFGDVLLLQFPFPAHPGSKLRPGVIVWDSGDSDVVVVPITPRHRNGPRDMPVVEWQYAGLAMASVARVDKLSVVSKASIRRTLGRLMGGDAERLRDLMCGIYCEARESF